MMKDWRMLKPVMKDWRMLKLVKDGEKIYLYRVGGNLLISTFSKGDEYSYILSRLSFVLIAEFWKHYTGFTYKGEFYGVTTISETARLIEELLKEN